MKIKVPIRFFAFALVAILGSSHAAAQIFTTLYNFTNNSDGANPFVSLILSKNTLYGTTYNGGTNGDGAVFKIKTDGSGFKNLYSFSGLNENTNSDGANPHASLILCENTLYGTTVNGGTNGYGTVFKINTDGTGFTNLHTFTAGSGGANPYANLVLSGNTLYGTVANGGENSGNGTVFAVNTDGSCFTNLYAFIGTNGAYPQAGLVLSTNTLYGTAWLGGSSNYGTVFKINTDGTDFTILYNFTCGTNGAYPRADLILSGNTLYGTASGEGLFGNSGYGTIFKINTDGSCFTNLYVFAGSDDGAQPKAGLILSGNTLYGTAFDGGSSGNGTVFAVNTNGTDFTILHSFSLLSGNLTNSDGEYPYAGLILSGNTLYGTASFGGNLGNGTVFALSIGSIPMNIQTSGQNPILTWGNPAFLLQAAPAVIGPWTTMPGAMSPCIVGAAAGQQFFRLVNTNSL